METPGKSDEKLNAPWRGARFTHHFREIWVRQGFHPWDCDLKIISAERSPRYTWARLIHRDTLNANKNANGVPPQSPGFRCPNEIGQPEEYRASSAPGS